MCNFAFCVDITQYLNELNSNLQGTHHLTNEMFAEIKAFESKLRLWELQLLSNNMAHFPTLRTEKPTDTKKYAEDIQILQPECSSLFQDFENMRPLSVHHLTKVETVPANFNTRL
jgi:hypothetical protein